MRLKLVGIFTCMIVVLGIFILYTNISIGKGPNRTNYENRENSMNKEKESSFASI
ncbi:hypothetical protein ACVWXX_000070 [Bacillus toyonensis]